MAVKREGHSKSAAWSGINQHRYQAHIDDPVTGTHHEVRVTITDDLPLDASQRLFGKETVRKYVDRIDLRQDVISLQEITSMNVEVPSASDSNSDSKRDDLHERRAAATDRRRARGSGCGGG